jgi:uncharacterized protein involved in exopolysaccharide biosynthesis
MSVPLLARLQGPPDEPPKRRRRRYLLTALIGHGVIWGLAIAVMLLWPRSYMVESSLIVPSSDPDARVDLKEVGQAYATPRATYDSKSLDPRVNYKEIMLSANVIDAAASAVGLLSSQYGEPRIKLIDQSSVMEITTSARSPELALAKAQAIHQIFQQRLTELRMDELTQREQAIERAVQASRNKLDGAQRDLLRFKVGAQIVTDKQLDEMALASTTLRRRRIELGQKLAHDRASVSSLSVQLSVPLKLAGWTLTLHADAVFLEHVRQLSTAAALLSEQSFKWDAAHPKVREATGQRDAAFKAMQNRAQSVLGQPVSAEDLRRMALVLQDRSREQLLREMVQMQASVSAGEAELAEIEQQWRRLSAELPQLAAQSAQLEELQRRVTFSEAVFTGAVGKTDVGNSNIFSSYPMVQTMVAPTRPERPSAPRATYVGAGAVAASVMLTVGLALAWLRLK